MWLFLFCPSLSLRRASCFGGSPHSKTPRMERSQATRSDTAKDHGGARQLRPPEAPSFTSSLMVMGADLAINFRNKTLPAVLSVLDVYFIPHFTCFHQPAFVVFHCSFSERLFKVLVGFKCVAFIAVRVGGEHP